SQGVGGYSALDFLVKVRGMGFIDAVRHLTGEGAAYKSEPPPPSIKPPKPFALPPKNINNDRVYAYLRGRGIDKGTLIACVADGKLYENTRGNCVFVGYDGKTPRFACERGTADGSKKDVSGSDKRFSFVLPPINPNKRNLACFESPIDALSDDTIHKINGDKWDGYRLSFGGVGSIAVISFLERNPQIENVRLCLDNDKAGKEATDRIIRELLRDKRFSHLKITVAPPPIGKDYSDTLQAVIQLHKQKSRSDRSKEAVNFI
ncbi:MAG: DUF3991 and toprim domain-containing protein, partial [Oscillospiraceae bacterium]|nr:DUF3991 and toprim domain-containing protein [Oscillospiraceae bacterium]